MRKLAPCSRVTFEMLMATILFQIFHTFHETRWFLTIFTTTCDISLARAKLIFSTHPLKHILSTPFKYPHPIYIKVFQVASYPSVYPSNPCMLSPICVTCPVYLILLDFLAPNSIWRALHTTKLLIIQLYPVSWYFEHLKHSGWTEETWSSISTSHVNSDSSPTHNVPIICTRPSAILHCTNSNCTMSNSNQK